MDVKNARRWAPRGLKIWLAAFAALALAALIRLLLHPWLGPIMPAGAFFLAAALVEYYCGLAPALAVMLLGLVLADYMFVPPYFQIEVITRADVMLAVIYPLMTLIVITLIERLRRAQFRAEQLAMVAQSRYEMLLRQDNEQAISRQGGAPGRASAVAGPELVKMDLSGAVFSQGGDHAVLLLHGLSSSPLELRYLARYLHAQGYTVSVPVLEGYSAGSPEGGMEQWIDAAVAEYDKLAAAHARVSVCGLSIGAALALALARRRPDLQALGLLSLTLSYDGWAIPWYRFLLHLAYYTPLRRLWRYRESAPYGLRNEALRGKVQRAMERGGISEVGPATISLPALHEARRLACSVRGQLCFIKNDCLVVHAIDDETSNPRNAQFVLRHIGARLLRTVWLGDSYHMITSDNEREAVARSVELFLRESEAISRGDASAGRVVSRMLARRLRNVAGRA